MMGSRSWLFAAALGIVGFVAGDASAQSKLTPGGGASIFDEVKVGLSRHDIALGGSSKESGFDMDGEVLFRSPSFLNFLWSPRPSVGFHINSDSNTNSLYAGLTWSGNVVRGLLLPNDSIFLSGSLGAAVHDGKLDIAQTDPLAQKRKSLGSPVLFHEGVEAGYSFDQRNSLALSIDHMSNAKLAKRNEGITNLGLKYGYKF